MELPDDPIIRGNPILKVRESGQSESEISAFLRYALEVIDALANNHHPTIRECERDLGIIRGVCKIAGEIAGKEPVWSPSKGQE